MQTHETREEWLQAFIDAARPRFTEVNASIPPNVRVAVGFTSKGFKGTRIGECWSDVASDDGHFEIFLKPTLNDTALICATLTHELIHAAVGLDKGHKGPFARVAVSLGLGGRMTATEAQEAWYTWALPIINELGPMPYGKITGGISSARKKQTTALLKYECPMCGFLARITAKHTQGLAYLRCPSPDCDGELMHDAPSEEGEED
jgi:predicted RNA-binding Zn-ribbon protein involved in translation (DUF1610 family)